PATSTSRRWRPSRRAARRSATSSGRSSTAPPCRRWPPSPTRRARSSPRASSTASPPSSTRPSAKAVSRARAAPPPPQALPLHPAALMDGPDLLRADAWAALLLLSALKAAFVLTLAALGSRLLRRQSAATRHLVWGVAFVAALAMPALLVLVPGWEVPVLPAEAVALWEAVPEPMPAGEVMGVTLPEAATPALPLNLLLLLLWAAGAALVLARWLAGVAGAVVLTMRARPLDEPAWREATAQAARRLGLRRPVTLRVSAALRSPMTWGVWRPVVLLPLSAAAWTEERRTVVLTHELGHVHRRDSLTQWIAQAALVLYWFNPLAWRGYRHLLTEREHACDDLVLSTGLRPSAYAEHLLQLARTLGREPRAAFALLPMARPSQVE